MDAMTKAILVGAATGGLGFAPALGYYQAQETREQAVKDQKDALQKQVSNQNALVNQAYGKRVNALGIGETAPSAEGISPMGNAASQSGAVLQSNVQGNNLLG